MVLHILLKEVLVFDVAAQEDWLSETGQVAVFVRNLFKFVCFGCAGAVAEHGLLYRSQRPMLLRTRRMNCIVLGRAPNARLIHLCLHVHLIPRNLHRPFRIILPHRSRIQHIIHHSLSLNILIFHQSLVFIRTALFYLIYYHAHANITPLLLINIHHFRRSKCIRFHGLVNPGQWLHDHVAAAAAIRLGISESDLWQGGTGGQAPRVPMIAAP